MNDTQINDEIIELISFIVEMDRQDLLDNHNKNFFSDLGMDSLIALEIIAAVEKKYRIEIPEDRLREMSTLDSAIALVKEFMLASCEN